MPELSYKTIGGITFLLILLASGTTYYLAETNDYKSCRGTWDLQESGQYQCSKTGELQWCYSLEYRGSGWWRCNVGKVSIVEEPKTEPYSSIIICNGKQWEVPENPTKYVRIKSMTGEETYYAECVE